MSYYSTTNWTIKLENNYDLLKSLEYQNKQPLEYKKTK